MQNETIVAPVLPGYRRDSKNRLVPEASIKQIDLLRDELVLQMVASAKELSDLIAAKKRMFFQQVDDFVALSAREYNVTLGGAKGNVTLESFDGLARVSRSVQDRLIFDERLQAAKELIGKCLSRWSEGAQPELITVVQDAFAVDKEGKINTGRVLELRRYAIEDEEWKQAMAAISDSLTVSGSASYVRFYLRGDATAKFEQIVCDMASA